jgi:hypothetical protein
MKNAVPRLVNQAIRELEDKFTFKDMEAQASFVTTLGSVTLSPSTLPTNFKSYRGKPFYTEFLGGSREISIAPNRQSVMRRWNVGDIGAPRHLLVDSGVVEMWPQSDGSSDYPDGQYRITLPYWQYFPDLAASTDTNWFTLNTQQYIINWAVWHAFLIDWDEKRAQTWEAQAEKEARRVILTGKKRYLTETHTLVPLQGVFDAPMEDY